MKKKEKIKISVIVPVYNGEKYLQECLDSIINQTYENIEIVIVNDGSTDSSLSIINRYKELDSRIVVVNKENGGVSTARNEGLNTATSEWIMFVDCDDTLELNAIEVLENAIKPDVEMIISETYYLWENGEKQRGHCKFSESKIFEGQAKRELIESIFYDNSMGKMIYIPSPFAKLYNKELLDRNNIKYIQGLKYGEDGIFNLLCFKNAKKVAFINELTYNYRRNPESATKKYDPKLIENYSMLLEKTKEVLIKENLYEEYENEYLYFTLRQVAKYLKKYFFRKEEKEKYIERKNKFKKLIETEPYYTAIFKKKVKYLPKKRKLMLLLLKTKSFSLLKLCYSLNKEQEI